MAQMYSPQNSVLTVNPTTNLPELDAVPNAVDELGEKLKDLKNLQPNLYLEKIDGYRDRLDQFIESKKKVCSGKFSVSVIGLNEAKFPLNKPTPLTKEEKKACYLELKNVQVEFINDLFTARKRFLDHVHENQVRDLTKNKENSIIRLNEDYQKRYSSK